MNQPTVRRRGRGRLLGGRRLGMEALEQRQLMTVSALSNPVAVPLYKELTTIRADGTVAPLATSGPTGYTPAQVRHAYGFDQITFSGGTVVGDGSGQTIAIVDAYDDPNIASDLHQFDLAFGLADPTFVKVNQNGGTTMPRADAGWSGEIALDVEWAHAIAPKAKILLVEASDASYTNLLAAVNYARNQAGVAAVSMSWGGGEFNGETNYDSYFTTPAGHSGVAFVVASGDSGAPAEYPAASPNVLSVGGTSLRLTSASTISSESAWSGSTGGLSAYEAEPTYQKGVVTQTTTRRATPDVSYDSDPNTGFPVYDSYGTSAPWAQYGGTSAAAPQWSALIAIADQGRALAGLSSLSGSQLLTSLYQLPSSDFHDVASGASAGSPAIAATAGYDLATGRGTPVANLIVGALVGSNATAAVASHLSISSSAAVTAGGTFSVAVSALSASNGVVSTYTGTVHFSSTDVAAGLPSDYTFTASDQGVHTFTVTLKTAGTATLSVADRVTSAISASKSITVTPAAANHLVFVQQPSTVTAGGVISPAVTVRVLDVYNNLVSTDNSDAVTLSLGSNPSGGILSGTTTVLVSGGVATFSSLSINQPGVGYSLVATSGSVAGALSSVFTVNAQPSGGSGGTSSSSGTIESFDAGLGAYHVIGATTGSALISTAAAHDGGNGLADSAGNDWIYRTDAGAQVKAGDTISVWLQFSGAADGRAYFGFGSSSTGSLSLVAAPNTGQLILQSNVGYFYVDVAAAPQTWLANHWYRLEVDWGTSGTIVGKVFDSNGTTLLQSVTGTTTAITSGGIGFRGFGSTKYWDTVSVSSGVNNFSTTSTSGTSTAAGSTSSVGQTQSSLPWHVGTVASSPTTIGTTSSRPAAAIVQQIFAAVSSSWLRSLRSPGAAESTATLTDEQTLELLALGMLSLGRR